MKGSDNSLIAMGKTDDSDFRNKVYGLPAPTAQEWQVLRQFFQHPWFQRVWVVQEVVLATRAIAILSDWQIEWSALGEAALVPEQRLRVAGSTQVSHSQSPGSIARLQCGGDLAAL